MSRSNAQFLVIFASLESPVSQLSNEVKHVKNGVVDLEIWSFEVGRQENLENVFKNPRCPPVVNRKSDLRYGRGGGRNYSGDHVFIFCLDAYNTVQGR